jgi:hypothetical protein
LNIYAEIDKEEMEHIRNPTIDKMNLLIETPTRRNQRVLHSASKFELQ